MFTFCKTYDEYLLIYFLPFPCFTKNIFNREPDNKVCVCVYRYTHTWQADVSSEEMS